MKIIAKCSKVGVVEKEREDTVVDTVVEFKIDPDVNGGEIRGKFTLNIPGDWVSRRYEVGKFYKMEIDPRFVEDIRPYISPGKEKKFGIDPQGDQPTLLQFAELAEKAEKGEAAPCPSCGLESPYNGKQTWVCKNEACGVDTFDPAGARLLGAVVGLGEGPKLRKLEGEEQGRPSFSGAVTATRHEDGNVTLDVSKLTFEGEKVETCEHGLVTASVRCLQCNPEVEGEKEPAAAAPVTAKPKKGAKK